MRFLELFFSLIKSIWFNIRFMPVNQAFHLPILIHYKTKINEMHRDGIRCNKINFGSVKIGFPARRFKSCITQLCVSGTIVFEGEAVIATGCELVVRGHLIVGDNFSCNCGTKIDAKAHSRFGRNVLIGHNCVFIDDDGHQILQRGKCINEKRGYTIGNNTWFARECLVLKGCTVADHVVVGARALLSGEYLHEHVVLAGVPAKVVKEEIDWKF